MSRCYNWWGLCSHWALRLYKSGFNPKNLGRFHILRQSYIYIFMKILVRFSFHHVNLYTKCGRGRPRANVLGLMLQNNKHTLHFMHKPSCCGSREHRPGRPLGVTGLGTMEPAPLGAVTLPFTGAARAARSFPELRGRDEKRQKGGRKDFFRFSHFWRIWGEFPQEGWKKARQKIKAVLSQTARWVANALIKYLRYFLM